MILLENLTKSFGTRTVLNGVSLEIADGQNTVIIGGSGAGKSVTLKLIVGLIEPGFAWVLQNTEVDEVLELPLADLRAGYRERRLVRRGIPFRTPTYEAGGHLIWGATARILGELLNRVRSGR